MDAIPDTGGWVAPRHAIHKNADGDRSWVATQNIAEGTLLCREFPIVCLSAIDAKASKVPKAAKDKTEHDVMKEFFPHNMMCPKDVPAIWWLTELFIRQRCDKDRPDYFSFFRIEPSFQARHFPHLSEPENKLHLACIQTLARHYHRSEECVMQVFALMVTNALEWAPPVTQLAQYMGLYKEASLLNHSCCPNATYSIHKGRLEVRACLPIRQGDEITIAYMWPLLGYSKESNQLRLEHNRGFQCRCRMCATPALTRTIVTKDTNEALAKAIFDIKATFYRKEDFSTCIAELRKCIDANMAEIEKHPSTALDLLMLLSIAFIQLFQHDKHAVFVPEIEPWVPPTIHALQEAACHDPWWHPYHQIMPVLCLIILHLPSLYLTEHTALQLSCKVFLNLYQAMYGPIIDIVVAHPDILQMLRYITLIATAPPDSMAKAVKSLQTSFLAAS